jgi:hypothetical protein
VVSLDLLWVTGLIDCVKHSLFAVLFGLALVAGCSKKPAESAPPVQSQPTDQSTTAPAADNSSTVPTPADAPVEVPTASPANAVISAPENGNMAKTLGDLTLAVSSYMGSTRSRPATFEEFVANSHVVVPPAPAGKKYALDARARVILVNQ